MKVNCKELSFQLFKVMGKGDGTSKVSHTSKLKIIVEVTKVTMTELLQESMKYLVGYNDVSACTHTVFT